MLEFILGMINNSTLLLFGVFVSASILNIPFIKKNIGVLFAFCIGVNLMQFVVYSSMGLKGAKWWYPLVTHIPSILLFNMHYKRKLLQCLFAVTSAYLCCQLSKWLGIIVLEMTGKQWMAYGSRAIITIILGFIIILYFASSISVILTKPLKTILIFSIPPFTYYLFDYTATVYTNLLYSGSVVVIEFLPFVLCVAYLVFSVVYFREYEEKQHAMQIGNLVEIKRIHAEKELEAFKRSEYAISLIRHDMRHLLNNILLYIEQGDTDKAKKYASEVIKTIDGTAMQRYCSNDLVNTILSSYESDIKEKGIKLDYTINIPETLPFSDVDLTSILSNGLENAVNAVSLLEESKRIITMDLHMHDGKLLLSIKNPYAHKVEMVDGLPVASEEHHGYGTKSIKHVTNKLNGNCQFIARDGQFVLRVVL